MTEADAKIQLQNLLRKIGVDNRTQAVWALANLPEFSETPRGFVSAADQTLVVSATAGR